MAEENYSKSLFTPKNILIYLVVGGIIYALVYYFVLSPKGGYSSQTNYQDTPAPQTSPATTRTGMTLALSALGNSGETGTAVLSEENGKTNVVVTVTGEPKGAVQPAHIHAGACPKPDKVVYALTDVVDGTSETTISASLAELVAQLPLAINVHQSAALIKNYVTCGDLK